MDLDLKNKNLKIIFLIFLYLLVFYFLIFKNILKLAEIKELIEQEDIKIGKLNYEKNVVLKALDLKKQDFEKDREKIEKQEEKSNKEKFDNIPSLFNYIEEKIAKNNIIFQSFGRSRKDGDKLKVTMVFNGSERNIKNFFKEIENENYDIDFSSSYLKISVNNNLLEVKTSLSASVLDKTDSLIDNNISDKDIFKRTKENIKEEGISNSYIRIGNKIYYRVSKKKEIENKAVTESKEDKKDRKSKYKKSDKKNEKQKNIDSKKEKVEERWEQMKRFTLIIFLILNTFIFPSSLNRDIDIIDMPLHEVLAVLSKETGKNLICSKEAKDIIIDTYFNKGEDVNSVLQFLAETYDLSLKKENNTTIFMLQSEKDSKKAKIIGKVTSNNMALKNVKVELKDLNKVVYTDSGGNFIIDSLPKDVYVCKISKKGYEERGEIVDTVKSINVLNVDLKENQNSYENKETSDELSNSNFYEIDGRFYYTKTFSLFNVSPDEVSKILHETFGENIKVSTLSKVNKLVVSAERDILENAISIIEDIDKNPKQVKITSQILDISNNLFEELGFDWVYRQNVESQERNSLTAIILGKAGLNGIGSTVNIVRQFNNKSDVLSAGINLLEATNDLVVSSVPTLMIASGEEGEFKVTEEVVVGVKTHREDKKERYTEPVFKEAGLIMKVKPFIKDDNYIVLEISLELSDFKFKKNILNLKDINSGTYNSEGGSKVGRGLTTKVRVKNGDTILLGGLKKSIQQNIESKIPILGDIPIISFFFKNTTKKNENSDMYIKLKVEIDG